MGGEKEGNRGMEGAGTSHLQNIGLGETMDQSSDGFPEKRAGKCAQTSVCTTLAGYKHGPGDRQPPPSDAKTLGLPPGGRLQDELKILPLLCDHTPNCDLTVSIKMTLIQYDC